MQLLMPQRCTMAGQPNRQPYVEPKSPIPLSTSISTSTTMKVWATGDPTTVSGFPMLRRKRPQKSATHPRFATPHTKSTVRHPIQLPQQLNQKNLPDDGLDHVSVQKGSVGAAYGNRIERFKSSEAFVMCGLAATNCSAGCCVRPVFQITVPQ